MKYSGLATSRSADVLTASPAGEKGRCIFDDDSVNDCIQKIIAADGVIVGSPVYFGGMPGSLKCLMDRVFYDSKRLFSYKPAAAVVTCRRGGASTAFDAINKYFMISSMPVVSSQYWNSVHGDHRMKSKRIGKANANHPA